MSKEILSKDQIKEIAGMLAKNPADSRNMQAMLSAAPKEKQRVMKNCVAVLRRAERLIAAEQKATKGRKS
jgi:cob(I)alamin adenosyltransferase